MKHWSSLPAGICCCVLLSVPAAAETCDQRFPGSCRVEVSTTVLAVKGETLQRQARQIRQPKQARNSKRVRHAQRARIVAAARVRTAMRTTTAAAPAVQVPKPAPPLLSSMQPKPGVVVDDAFNVLTTGDSSDSALEQALMARRDQLLGFAWP